jgi:hypothetical protein
MKLAVQLGCKDQIRAGRIFLASREIAMGWLVEL